MTLLLLNLTSVVSAIVMTGAAFMLWRLTRSTGVLVLFLSCLYLTAVRLLIAGAETFDTEAWVLGYRSHLIAPFWPAMALGFLLLVRSLRLLYGAGRDRRKESGAYYGPERRKS